MVIAAGLLRHSPIPRQSVTLLNLGAALRPDWPDRLPEVVGAGGENGFQEAVPEFLGVAREAQQIQERRHLFVVANVRQRRVNSMRFFLCS